MKKLKAVFIIFVVLLSLTLAKEPATRRGFG